MVSFGFKIIYLQAWRTIIEGGSKWAFVSKFLRVANIDLINILREII